MMTDRKTTIIMKFGGAAVASPEAFAQVADRVIARKREGKDVVVVVSAMGRTTDDLIALAHLVHPHPPEREFDMLVSVGERISIALLAMALALKGEPAISFTGSQSGIITSAEHSGAKIIDVRPYRILPHLEAGTIVIVAGFQGVSRQGEITTLGRSGSDTTAVALGISLQAELVEFYKDVGGVYSADPKSDPNATHFCQLSFADALAASAKTSKFVLHPRCIALAAKNHIPLLVRSFKSEGGPEGTWITGSERSKVHCPQYETDEVSLSGMQKNDVVCQ